MKITQTDILFLFLSGLFNNVGPHLNGKVVFFQIVPIPKIWVKLINDR